MAVIVWFNDEECKFESHSARFKRDAATWSRQIDELNKSISPCVQKTYVRMLRAVRISVILVTLLAVVGGVTALGVLLPESPSAAWGIFFGIAAASVLIILAMLLTALYSRRRADSTVRAAASEAARKWGLQYGVQGVSPWRVVGRHDEALIGLRGADGHVMTRTPRIALVLHEDTEDMLLANLGK